MISNIDQTAAGTSQDFARLAELQQLHSKDTNSLELLEVKMNELALRSSSAFATDYVILQEALAARDTEIKALFARHPEWCADSKSVKTPFGEVAQRTVTELEVPNPAMTVALIEAKFAEAAGDYLRVEKSPNIEALESLSNDELVKLGVQRVSTERVTVKPAKVSVAKTVKAAKAKAV